jgi:DNA-binding NarL/FixJ family response regulator
MKIALADDHAMVIEGLRLCFESDPDCQVIGSAEDGEGIVKLVLEHQPDIAIIDVTMPGLNGIEAVRKITADKTNQTRCMVLSMHRDPEYVKEAFRAGARAYLVKSSAFEELKGAAEAIQEGKTYVSPEIANVLVENLDSDADSPANALKALTPRERQTMKLLAEGLSIKEIAFELGISYKTVHTFRTMIMQKLEISNIAELTRFAIKANLIEID